MADDDLFNFGEEDELEIGHPMTEEEEESEPTFLDRYPMTARIWGSISGLFNTAWLICGILQPVFKYGWIFFILHMGIAHNKRLSWADLNPLGPPLALQEEEEEEE